MKRRFFQIHLLTAVVGMLTTSRLLWLNLKEQRVQFVYPIAVNKGPLTLQAMLAFNKGWPNLVFQECSQSLPILTIKKKGETSRLYYASDQSEVVTVEVPWENYYGDWKRFVRRSGNLNGTQHSTWQDVLRDIPEVRNSAPNAYPNFEANASRGDGRFYWKAVAINAAIAFAILIAVMIVIEWFLRRREAVKK